MVRQQRRSHIAAAIRLLGGVCLAAFLGTVGAEDAASTDAAPPAAQAKPAEDPALKLKAASQLRPSPARVQARVPARAPQASPAPAPAVRPLLPDDIGRQTASELNELILAQRNAIKMVTWDETARRNLGLISIEIANRILAAQSRGRAQEASQYTAVIKTTLADTLWRVTQLVREQPARAQAALGLYFADGILAPSDPARSCDFFSRSANAGQPDAAYRAAQCAAKTQPERARQWLQQAALGGNPAAQERMGRACIEGASIDATCAKKWLQAAAAQGRVSAISVLAWIYVREGTAESLTQASILYRTAADAGDFAAQNNLGECFETGRGVSRDPAQALAWYQRSAESGFGPAQFNLGRLLAFGLGTARDTAAARQWAMRAQAQGIAQATELLKLIADAEKAPQASTEQAKP